MNHTELYFAIQNYGLFIALGIFTAAVLYLLIAIAFLKLKEWRYKRKQRKNTKGL
jgi:prolipoprotein diacylglyceryltransferase